MTEESVNIISCDINEMIIRKKESCVIGRKVNKKIL